MSLQNNRFYERHLEKMLIGVALAFLGGVGVYFYVLDPIRMTVAGSNQEDVGTQELENQIAAKIKDLDGRLQKPSPIKPIKIPDEIGALKQAMGEQLSPHASLAVGPGQPGLPFTTVSDQTVYDVPTIPSAEDLKVLAGYAVLKDVTDPQQMQEYIRVLGDQLPRDFRYVTVSGAFDLGKLQQAFANVDNARRMPSDWALKAMNLTTVTLERQTLDPLTNQWGAPDATGKFKADAVETIALPPLCPDFRPDNADLAKKANPDSEVLEAQEEIRQQPFPPLTNDRYYQPPEAVGLTEDKKNEYSKLDAALTKVRQDVANLDKAPAAEPGAPAGPRPGMGPGARGGPGRPPMAGLPPAAPVDKENERKTLQDREQDLTAQIDALLGLPGSATTRPANNTPGRIRVRAHDLTVKSGTTYRYRLVVSVLNPLFRRPELTKDQAAKYAKMLSLTARASAWSNPVTTQPEFQIFVQNTNLKAPNTGFLAFRIIAGRWQPASLSPLRPGQSVVDTATYSVGGVDKSFPVRMGATLVDVAGETPENARVILMYDDGRLEERSLAVEKKRIDEFTRTEGQKTALAK
jgi:hypothetical protein